MPRIKAGTGKTAAVETARGVDEYLGICSTCNHASGCAHRIKNAGVAIWDCEDYDDYVRLNGTFVGGEPDPVGAPVRSRPRDDGAVLVEYRGLCKNCAKREYCAFPRPEGGVWHCEEYD
jgi:Fe-S cluster biogenesis protein NfuA